MQLMSITDKTVAHHIASKSIDSVSALKALHVLIRLFRLLDFYIGLLDTVFVEWTIAMEWNVRQYGIKLPLLDSLLQHQAPTAVVRVDSPCLYYVSLSKSLVITTDIIIRLDPKLQ